MLVLNYIKKEGIAINRLHLLQVNY